MPSSGVQTCALDRKSTRLNSSHTIISYAVFCLKKNVPVSPPLAPAPRSTPHRLAPSLVRAPEVSPAGLGGAARPTPLGVPGFALFFFLKPGPPPEFSPLPPPLLPPL